MRIIKFQKKSPLYILLLSFLLNSCQPPSSQEDSASPKLNDPSLASIRSTNSPQIRPSSNGKTALFQASAPGFKWINFPEGQTILDQKDLSGIREFQLSAGGQCLGVLTSKQKLNLFLAHAPGQEAFSLTASTQLRTFALSDDGERWAELSFLESDSAPPGWQRFSLKMLTSRDPGAAPPEIPLILPENVLLKGNSDLSLLAVFAHSDLAKVVKTELFRFDPQKGWEALWSLQGNTGEDWPMPYLYRDLALIPTQDSLQVINSAGEVGMIPAHIGEVLSFSPQGDHALAWQATEAPQALQGRFTLRLLDLRQGVEIRQMTVEKSSYPPPSFLLSDSLQPFFCQAQASGTPLLQTLKWKP